MTSATTPLTPARKLMASLSRFRHPRQTWMLRAFVDLSRPQRSICPGVSTAGWLGGQIGYQVAPRHRRRGHATAILAAALGYCRDTLGVTRVLLTCAESNTASRAVIEANGAVLENTLDGECRYWIAIPGTRRQAE